MDPRPLRMAEAESTAMRERIAELESCLRNIEWLSSINYHINGLPLADRLKQLRLINEEARKALGGK